jgi:hypothetical protein
MPSQSSIFGVLSWFTPLRTKSYVEPIPVKKVELNVNFFLTPKVDGDDEGEH